MSGRTPCVRGGLCPSAPTSPGGALASDQGSAAIHSRLDEPSLERTAAAGSALTLLVARVGADDHHPAVPADHPALVADPLDARLDLHRVTFFDRRSTRRHLYR